MEFLKTLHIKEANPGVSTGKEWISSKGETISSFSPVDGKLIGTVVAADREAYDAVVKKAGEAFKEWRT
ncbi:MAG TPA: aldehyde dehydrogenase family protein, partial [Chitinophagaceae bacterium]|nr:aldehyde dehydrogenase family protein [Chitinophagaceae bacterium]